MKNNKPNIEIISLDNVDIILTSDDDTEVLPYN